MKCVSCNNNNSLKKYCRECMARINERLEKRGTRNVTRKKVRKMLIDGFLTLPSREWFIKSMTVKSSALEGVKKANMSHLSEMARKIIKFLENE